METVNGGFDLKNSFKNFLHYLFDSFYIPHKNYIKNLLKWFINKYYKGTRRLITGLYYY